MSDLFESKNISPMLLYETEPFDDENCIYELKLDGARCIAYIEPNSVVLQNKRFKDVSGIYPELADMRKCVRDKVILDGELVVLKEGKPDFYALQKRTLMHDEFKISLAAKRNAVRYNAFDILYCGGEDLTNRPLTERKAVLAQAVREGYNLSVSRYIEKNGVAFFKLVKAEGLEGIVAKRKDGLYHIGKRTRDWLKIKVMTDEELLVCGFTRDESGAVKDLILGCFDESDNLVCRGKVYLGVKESERGIVEKFARTHAVQKPWFGKYASAVWLEPELVGTVRYMQETASGSMRQPVWKGLRFD